MKKTIALVAIGSSLLLALPALRAADAPATKPGGGPKRMERSEHGLLPPPLVEKLNLTEDQKTKIKAIEESWVKSRNEYMAAHKAEADAAKAAAEEAKKSDDPAKRKEAREKMGQLMAGLKPQRDAAMDQVKSILNDEQKKILEDARKSFQESRGKGKGKGKGKGAGAN